MKKFLIFTAVLFLGACNKSSQEEEPNSTNENLSFSLNIQEGLNISNLRVGNHIPIELKEINDSNPESGFIYVLKPMGNDATRHQVLGVDYDLKVKKDNKLTDTSFIEIENVNDLPTLVIIPKVAGTFQLDFQLQKYDPTSKKYVGNIVEKQLVFNVVKINFHFPTQEVRTSGVFRNSVHRREFKFSIDDGNREYDLYLSNYTSSKRYEYVTHYDNQVKSGEFSLGNQIEFRDYIENIKEPKPMHEMPQTVTIEITQYLNNGLKNIIKYENVQLEY